jgi:hypothetical protein
VVEPNRLRDEQEPNAILASTRARAAGARPGHGSSTGRFRGRSWTAAGRVFAAGAGLFLVGLALVISGVVRDWARYVLVFFGLGLSLSALGAQVIADQLHAKRSLVGTVLFIVFGAPHLLIVPAVGIGLIIFAVGTLIDYPGFR